MEGNLRNFHRTQNTLSFLPPEEPPTTNTPKTLCSLDNRGGLQNINGKDTGSNQEDSTYMERKEWIG